MLDDLRGLTARLDEALMLDAPRFHEARDRALQAFQKLRVRPPAHAGAAYDGQEDAARERLEGYFADGQDPGPIGPRAPKADEELRGILAPHIDPGRGARAYAWAYKTVAERAEADLFVVLGTAHQPCQRLFVPCDMDYCTSLGVIPTDRDFMASLRKRWPVDVGTDLLVHRMEHSVEFQALFLSYVYGEGPPISIAPILCSSLLTRVPADKDPMDVPEVRDFVEALREVIASCGRKVCVVGGVDLAHIGPKFGHPQPVLASHLVEVSRDDHDMLGHVLKLDAAGFLDSVRRDNDSRNICGLTSIYALLHVVGADRAELLRYGQAHEEDTQSVVTFASMAFWRRRKGRKRGEAAT
jgi:AmmeMemoRadiSam system protein B